MAGKKKVKKKAKKAKEGNPDEENKEENLAPEYIDPKLAFPEVDIEIKLASPPNIEELSKSIKSFQDSSVELTDIMQL